MSLERPGDDTSSLESHEDDTAGAWCGWCCCGTDASSQSSDASAQAYMPADASSEALSLVEIRTFVLPQSYDPLREYVRAFSRGDSFHESNAPRRTFSVNATAELIKDARDALLLACEEAQYPKSARPSPRDLARHLAMYERAIHQETGDMEKRALYIAEYEQFKGTLDTHDLADAEKARLYTDLLTSAKHSPAEKLTYYQKAILYTNEPTAKQALRQRYADYCEQLKNSDV